MSFSLLHPERNKLKASEKRAVVLLLKKLREEVTPRSRITICGDLRDVYPLLQAKKATWCDRLAKVVSLFERKLSDPSVRLSKKDESWVIAGLMYFHIEDDVIHDDSPFDMGFADDCYAVEYVISKLSFGQEI